MDRHYNGQRGKQRKQKAKHRQNTTKSDINCATVRFILQIFI
jgi:hypothetical protein